MKPSQAFTLIELLVVVSIIALLIAVLLPVLGAARHAAQVTQDLGQVRQMAIAHHAYMSDNRGQMINAGLPHGTAPTSAELAWVTQLRDYCSDELILRSPLDQSPHWPGGQPVPNTPGEVYRLTSYGLNNFLANVQNNGRNPWGGPAWSTLDRVLVKRSPTELIHFLPMAFEGDFAGADHPHVESWDAFGSGGEVVAQRAGQQVQTNVAGGELGTFEARANWGYLDGHATTQAFGTVYQREDTNQFDPEAQPVR